MSYWGDVHSEAMDFTDDAMSARRRGELEEAHRMFSKALELELDAIELMGDIREPYYSTMYRSAGWLALDCHDYRLAEKLAATALAKDPPGYLVVQLREVLERAKFGATLSYKGLELGQDQLQLSLLGSTVGHGEVLYDDFVPRVDGIRKLLNRYSEFAAGEPHSDGNGVAKSGNGRLPIVLSTPSEGSMTISVKVGMPSQASLPGVMGSAELIDGVLDVIETVSRSDRESLAVAYPDEAYRRNFVHLVKQIAPDGINVSQVGFNYVNGSRERRLPLNTTKYEINDLIRPDSSADDEIEEAITGHLLYADATKERNQWIRVIQDDGTERRIKVPAGMMDDIVRPLWNEEVTARCVVRGKRNVATLVEIDEAP